jgi:hypothetical protein
MLLYCDYSYKLTQEASGVKRRTLLNWQNKYKEYGINGLIYGNRSLFATILNFIKCAIHCDILQSIDC